MRGEEIAYYGVNAAGEGGVHYVSVFGYPSGEPRVMERPDCVDRVLLRPTSMQGFLGGLFWIDALIERGHPSPDLILPFVPGARQDRLNDDGDYLFTAKSIARMVNDRNLPRVTVLDPHSDVIAALIDRCEVIHAHECIHRLTEPYSAVISPDAGAEKRAGSVARKLGRPLVHGWKTRDVSTGAIAGFGIEPGLAVGSRVLVVDDICDGGGTFVGLAKILKASQVEADLFVTHGIFSRGTPVLLSHYRKVFCTDSVLAQRPDINIDMVCQRLLAGEDAK